MHGSELCNRITGDVSPRLPAAPFENCGLTPWRSPACAPAGTFISQRPFAPPQRLPVSRPPFRDRSSRPAASMRCRTFAEPVRLTAPSLSPVSPGLGEIATVNPFPGSSSAISISPRIPAPLQGFCALPDRSFNPATDREAHLPNASDCPSLPAACPIGIVSTADQRSRLASLPFGSLFLEPLGTKCHVRSKHYYSQMNFAIANRFSSRLLSRILLQLRDTGFE